MTQINIKQLNIALRGVEPAIARRVVAQLPAAIQREAMSAQAARSAGRATAQAAGSVNDPIAYRNTRDSHALAVALARNIVAQAETRAKTQVETQAKTHVATDHDPGKSS